MNDDNASRGAAASGVSPAPPVPPTPPARPLRPLALHGVLGLLALGTLAGVAVNVVWLSSLMDFLRQRNALAEAGVTEDLVYSGFMSGVLTAYGALLLMLAFVHLGHGWARIGWLGCLAFTLLTEAPWLYLHWVLDDLFGSLGAKNTLGLYTPATFNGKLAVLGLLLAGSVGLFLPLVGRWLRESKAARRAA